MCLVLVLLLAVTGQALAQDPPATKTPLPVPESPVVTLDSNIENDVETGDFVVTSSNTSVFNNAESVELFSAIESRRTEAEEIVSPADAGTIRISAEDLEYEDGDIVSFSLTGLAGPFTGYGLADGLPSLAIRQILAASDGSVWVGTDSGLAVISPGEFDFSFFDADSSQLPGDDIRGLADILRRYTGGRSNATQEQNLALRWVPDGYLHDVWEALGAIGLNEPGAHSISNVVSCPGTDSCKLGITSSMGLAKAIREELGTWNGLMEDDGVKKIRIKMSGCPNGCGLHHIANIGFHGAAIKGPDGSQIPAYEMFLGGNYGDNRVEDSRIGSRIPKVKVPAKLAPRMVREIATYYKDNRQDGEAFNAFLDRVGVEELTAVAAAIQESATSGEVGGDLYVDWERTNNYVLERGEGECAV